MPAAQSCMDWIYLITPGFTWRAHELFFPFQVKSRITPSAQWICTQRGHAIFWLKFLPEQITVIHAVPWKCGGCADGQIIPEKTPNGLCMGHSFLLVVALSTVQEGQRGIDSPSPC